MYCLRVASHASLVGDGRTGRRRRLLQKGREGMKNRAVLVCPVSLYQKKICWVVCGALLLVCVPDGEIRLMERGNSGGVKPCLAHAESLSLAGNEMKSSRWNITFKAFKLRMLTNLFLLLCSLLLLNAAFQHYIGACTSWAESLLNELFRVNAFATCIQMFFLSINSHGCMDHRQSTE